MVLLMLGLVGVTLFILWRWFELPEWHSPGEGSAERTPLLGRSLVAFLSDSLVLIAASSASARASSAPRDPMRIPV
jgi:hypothetical protein